MKSPGMGTSPYISSSGCWKKFFIEPCGLTLAGFFPLHGIPVEYQEYWNTGIPGGIPVAKMDEEAALRLEAKG